MLVAIGFWACTPQNNGAGAGGLEPTTVAAADGESETYFVVNGAINATADPALVALVKNRAGIWTLNLVTSRSVARETGRSYGVNLFFSRQFDGRPGAYPVQSDYAGSVNALGGSFVGDEVFSHDTAGEAEFLEFGAQISVRFEYTTYSANDRDPDRKSVTVSGEAVVPRGEF